MFKLSEAETRSLLSQPESGMGYQFVEATLRNDSIERGIAYNAELLFLGNETQAPLRMFPYPKVLTMAQTSGDEIRSLRVITPREPAAKSRSSVVREASHTFRQKKATSASEAAVERTNADEVFVRFSAYENDRRITADRSLLPGSYATSEEDAEIVETGRDAVARYALPDSAPASYRFTIEPRKGTDIQRGIVAPANNHPGGGVEVIFPSGTGGMTVTVPPTKLPDE